MEQPLTLGEAIETSRVRPDEGSNLQPEGANLQPAPPRHVAQHHDSRQTLLLTISQTRGRFDAVGTSIAKGVNHIDSPHIECGGRPERITIMLSLAKHFTLGNLSIAHAAAFSLIGMTLAACSGEDPTTANPPPNAIVDVPEIKGAVAAEDFCALADEIHCAGAVGCCSGADVVYADVEECLQESKCSAGLGQVLDSPLVENGEISYDADAAGDYLRQLEKAVSQCAPHPEAIAQPIFLVGKRGENEDCTPTGSDRSSTFACKPGLVCQLSPDPMTGEPVGSCQPKPPAPTEGIAGAACATGEDCISGTCEAGACTADVNQEYCVRPPEKLPPVNADPTHLYIDLSGSNSGTSGDITLQYLNNGKYWECTITDTLSDGQEKVCAVSATGSVSNSNKEYFIMEMNSSDGAKIDTVCACSAVDGNKCSTAIECAGTFNDYGDKAGWCSDSSFNVGLWANACKKVWLDSSGNGSCTKLQVNSYDDNFTYCTD